MLRIHKKYSHHKNKNPNQVIFYYFLSTFTTTILLLIILYDISGIFTKFIANAWDTMAVYDFELSLPQYICLWMAFSHKVFRSAIYIKYLAGPHGPWLMISPLY